jgi:succinate dehydrogenase/fumarate reductase flavoprotein subunit
MEQSKQQQYNCDALVVGTGASGMATAISAAFHGLDVLVVDKAPHFGGTTARSGGWLWIPGSRLAKEQGIHEPAGGVRAYIQHEAGSHFDESRVAAFIEKGPEAVDFFTQNTSVQFDMPPVFPDYHAETPGGAKGGRSMVTRPFSGLELGDFIKVLGAPVPELTVFGRMLASGQDIRHFMRAFKSWESFRYVTKRLGRHVLDTLRHGRGMTLTNGNALAGRLAKSALDLKIPIWLSTKVTSLVHEGNSVRGAIIERDGVDIQVNARLGVVLACGGFPHDVERRNVLFAHARAGAPHFSPSPATNCGDGLRMGETMGGYVDPTIPHAAAWTPVSVTTRTDGSQGVMPHFIDRAKPGVIAVTPQGKRFTNESNSYHDFVQAMVQNCKQNNDVFAWLLCDHKTLRNYGLGCVAPFPLPIGRHLRSGYLRKGDTIERLAQQLEIDPAVLAATVKRYNELAQAGNDVDFGRGTTAYNRFQGDPLNEPNPCIAPVEHGPYYAIRLVIGDIGTFAGLAVDERTRVLSKTGSAIDGLYAVGNDAASIMGGAYPGAGITLGPALTFGYIAGKQLAAQNGRAAAQPE